MHPQAESDEWTSSVSPFLTPTCASEARIASRPISGSLERSRFLACAGVSATSDLPSSLTLRNPVPARVLNFTPERGDTAIAKSFRPADTSANEGISSGFSNHPSVKSLIKPRTSRAASASSCAAPSGVSGSRTTNTPRASSPARNCASDIARASQTPFGIAPLMRKANSSVLKIALLILFSFMPSSFRTHGASRGRPCGRRRANRACRRACGPSSPPGPRRRAASGRICSRRASGRSARCRCCYSPS